MMDLIARLSQSNTRFGYYFSGNINCNNDLWDIPMNNQPTIQNNYKMPKTHSALYATVHHQEHKRGKYNHKPTSNSNTGRWSKADTTNNITPEEFDNILHAQMVRDTQQNYIKARIQQKNSQILVILCKKTT